MNNTFRIVINEGVSRGRDTYGYGLLTARLPGTVRGGAWGSGDRTVLARVNGGGYDMWNTLLCIVLCKQFQSELQTALEGATLGEGDGERAYYCFHRTSSGEIFVNGAGGWTVTALLLRVLGLTKRETKIGKGKWSVEFSPIEMARTGTEG